MNKIIKSVRAALGIEKRSDQPQLQAMSLLDPAFAGWLGGEPTSSGVDVTEHSALRNLTIFAILRVISESIASLPLVLYERTPRGRTEAFSNPIHDLLSVAPNPEMSAFTFWESFTGALALGNAYAFIEKDVTGRVLGLWPLDPRNTFPWRAPDDSLKYKTTYWTANGQVQEIYDASQVLHCPLFSFMGDLGWSPIKMARESIGAAIATERFSARFFGSGTRPGGIMSSPTVMKPETVSETQQAWQSLQGGANQGKTAFLMGDWKYQPLSLSPEESQFIESQQFNRTQLAALWRVPPHMIGDTSRLSNGNHSEQTLQFVCDVIRPYTVRIQLEIQRKLFPATRGVQSKYFADFDMRERLKGDPQTMQTAYSVGRNGGWYSVNDIREDLSLNPIGPEGDLYLVPVNYQALGNLLNVPAVIPHAVPTEQVRNTLGSYRTAYLHTMRDGVSRMCTRDTGKRDAMAVTKTFEHILLSLSEVAADEVRSTVGQNDWKPDAAKAIKDHLRSISERVSTWTTQDVDTITSAELTKAVKAMSFAAHHSAADYTAKKAIEHEQE